MKMKFLFSLLPFVAVAFGGLNTSAAYGVKGYYSMGAGNPVSDKAVAWVKEAYYIDSGDRTVAYLTDDFHTAVYTTTAPVAGTVLENWKLTGYDKTSPTELTTTYAAADTLTLTYSSLQSLKYRENTTEALKLVANYRWMNYTLSYDANGGTWSGGSPAAAAHAYNDKVTALADGRATKTGFHVTGWNTAKDGSGRRVACGAADVTGETLGVTVDNQSVTLYAQWEADTHTVTLSAEDAENPYTESVTATFGSVMPSIAVLPTRTGHAFGGYYTEKDGKGAQYYKADGTSARDCDLTAAVTLYAKWTVNACKVTFRVEGNGSVSPSGSGTYSYGTVVNVSATPGAGSVFRGWTDGEKSASRSITVTGDATYTAVFSLTTCTLTFVYYSTYQQVTVNQTYDYGAAVTPPTDVDNRPGHKFIGWSPNVPSTATANERYVAQYKANLYYVVFDGNGATSGNTLTQEFGYTESKALNKCQYKRTGYTFVGWSRDKNAKTAEYADGEVVGGLIEEGSITLYAVWTANSYTVEFDGNGATGGSMANQSFSYDKSQALRANKFTKTGQTFVCWKTDDGRTFTDRQTVKNLTDSGTITLRAMWSGNHFVVFDGNGAPSGSMGVQTFTSDEAQALYPNAYEKLGYTFGGWATNETDAAALSPRYSDGETVLLEAPEGATNTLYAVWQTNRYSIVFHPGAADVGGTMEPLADYAYDTVLTLPPCAYTNYASSGFLGWAQTEGGEVAFSDGATVSNLTAEAGGTAALYAVWGDEGELSKAVGLTNACLKDTTEFSAFAWQVLNGVGRTGGPCAACEKALESGGFSTMEMTVVGPGTLSFWWKCGPNKESDIHSYKVSNNGTEVKTVGQPQSSGWVLVELPLGAGLQTIAWESGRSGRGRPQNPLYVDDVRWEPKSTTEFTYTDGSGSERKVSVPHSWVDAYFTAAEVESAGGYKTLLEGTSGKPGWPVSRWQEYIAGTIPTNAESVFRVTAIEVENGSVNLTWSPDLREADPPRKYEVYGKARLEGAAWEPADYSVHRFFKVEVHLK